MIAWVQRVIRNQLRLKLVDQSTEGHAIEEALHRLDAHVGIAVGLHLDPHQEGILGLELVFVLHIEFHVLHHQRPDQGKDLDWH